MSDLDLTVPDRAEVADGRAPSPGAQAASRARRIGGRPSPRPRPAPSADEDRSVAAAEASGRVATVTTTAPTPVAPPAAKEDDTETLRRRLDRLRWIPAMVAGIAVAALAASILALSHGVWWATPSASATRDEVLAAAKTCLARTNSYDYRKLDQAEAAGLACATGRFRDSYKQSMETVVRKLAPERKATQEVQVDKAGVESVSKDGTQWVVLIYGQQKVTNTTTQQPRLDILSARVTMDRVDGKWLISALSAA